MQRVGVRIGVPTKILDKLRERTKGVSGERGNGTALTGVLEEMLERGASRKQLSLSVGEISEFNLLIDVALRTKLKERAAACPMSLKHFTASIIATLSAE